MALVERAAFPRRKVCGEFISAETLPVLEACGVAGDFLGMAGPPVRRLAGYAGDTMVEAPLPHAGAGWGRALGREHLDMLLRDAAITAGARPFQPAEIVALRREGDEHVLSLRREDAGEEISARVVIAACGSWNAKGPFAVDAKPRPSDLLAFKAHLRGGTLAEGVMPLLAFPGGYGGLVHSDGGRLSLSCCIRRDALARAREIHRGKAGEAVLRHILASTEGARRALEDATVEGAILSAGPIRPRHPAAPPGGRVLRRQSGGRGPSHHRRRHQHGDPVVLAAGAIAGRRRRRILCARLAKTVRLRLHASSVFAHLAMNDHSRAAAARLIHAFPQILTWGAALSGKVAPIMPPRGRETAIGIRHDAA